MRIGSALFASLTIAAMAYGCVGKRSQPQGVGLAVGTTSGAGAAGGGSILDAQGGSCSDEGACGSEVHAVSFDTPNLYFVFDASGSMSEIVEGTANTRYQVVRTTAIELVESLGALINVGAAVFPGAGHECNAGAETMTVTPGDPVAAKAKPTLAAFKSATQRTPHGGTPTAPTLAALEPSLAKLTGRTVVLLLTDGGPNCNLEATCTPDECMPVIEKQCPNQACCDPSTPDGDPRFCLDRANSVAAVKAIHDLGIDVYVIGVTDLDLYAGVLDEMAVAGGVPNPSGAKYTEVDDLNELAAVFAYIASQAIRCDISLATPPTDKGFTNVYFDCDVLKFDPADGWTWSGEDAVTLHGDACAKLKSGTVSQVKVVTGCPTETPK